MATNKPQSLKEWAMAGGGVPLQYKDRPIDWHRKVAKFAAGGEVHMDEGGAAFYPRVGNIKAKNFKPAKPMPIMDDPRAMEFPQDIDLSIPTRENLEMSRRMAQREADLKRQQEGDRSPLEKLAGGVQAGRFLGSALTQGINAMPTRIAKGDEAADKFMQERLYKPEQPTAYEYAGDVGDFLEKLETDYKIPPVLPEAMALQYLTSPAASQAKKAAGRGAQALEKRLDPLVSQALERGGLQRDLLLGLGQGAQANVVKPKGGNWLAGSIDRAIDPMRQTVLNETGLQNLAERAGVDVSESVRARQLPESAMNRWLETKLGKYMRNEMATPEDPLRALAERGVMHYEPNPTGYNIAGPRAEAGFPEEGMGVSDLAKNWEGRADTFVNRLRASDMTGYYPKAVEENPWLLKVPPETRVYEMLSGADDDLGFRHLADELRNAVNPESGLPANLRMKYKDLEKVTVPQAVERVAKINDWRAAQKYKADISRAMGPATQVVKEYPEQGFKWVELRQPKETISLTDDQLRSLMQDRDMSPEEISSVLRDPEMRTQIEKMAGDDSGPLADALKYEGETMGHCVGGYCPDVVEGRSRIYSLRDKKGQPHVTIEVAPGPRIFDTGTSDGRPGPENIVQIKGKGNKAPKEDYLPAVQDFVRSGNFGKIGDLGNTGLRKVSIPEFNIPESYYTVDELSGLLKESGVPESNLSGHLRGAGFARGGEVRMQAGGLLKGMAKALKHELKVKPPSDNIATVRDANFQYPKTIGNQTVKLADLKGGVRMSDPSERKRVEALAQKISSPNGYISRIIVDHNNDVIEGQHRLEALRYLGIEDVPVYKIEDLSDSLPVEAMKGALSQVGPIHSDHVGQLVGQALENIAEHGFLGARDFDYGRYQKHYNAALDAAQKNEADITKGGLSVVARAMETK